MLADLMLVTSWFSVMSFFETTWAAAVAACTVGIDRTGGAN